jgi:hypothetical protein
MLIMRKSLRLKPFLYLVMSAAVLMLVLSSGALASKQTLEVVSTKAAPAGLDDAIWKKVKPLQVPFEGKEKFAGAKTSVDTKAVYTDSDIYFLFSWKDEALSVTKGAWTYDGAAWSHQAGDEDRISLLFEINRINNYATKGCAVLCHVPAGAPNAKDGKFGTLTETEKGDLWHWKAARSDPAGYADDGYLTKISETKGGRKGDAGKGGDKRNEIEDKSMPKYMLAPGKELAKNGILIAEDAVEITDYSIFKAGDVLTYRMPVRAEGSFADIAAVSRYADGTWTVMLSRKLATGNDDDVEFNTKKKYSFTMALFDDSSDEDSYDSETLTLEFKR